MTVVTSDHAAAYDRRGRMGIGIRRLTIADMSERGWREFLAADGVDDWVVLHGRAWRQPSPTSPAWSRALSSRPRPTA
jgi:hypothetical protein